ncbi:hypothetical protein EMCRGX_G027723 [Ephydatia muelleri]|eukprot:Em0020g866a
MELDHSTILWVLTDKSAILIPLVAFTVIGGLLLLAIVCNQVFSRDPLISSHQPTQKKGKHFDEASVVTDQSSTVRQR